MPYITVPQSPIYHQITLDDILSGRDLSSLIIRSNATNTRTYFCKYITDKQLSFEDTVKLIDTLSQFVNANASLYEVDRHSLYNSFVIPKKSGGVRHIDAPLPELDIALRQLKNILEQMGASYHTSAAAYVKGRSAVDSVRKHQRNESNWFLKLDFSNFFGSTTPEFVMDSISKIFPFSEIMKLGSGRQALTKALDLCFLDGGLPQGTPISPMLTNLVMIPIDYKLNKALRDRRFVYTRYADDILISSRSDFPIKVPLDIVRETLESEEAPYKIKDSKTRKGSRAGANWNLGVMLNKDNKITIGNKNKKRLRATLHNYILDKKNGAPWAKEDVQSFNGTLSYYRMIEADYVDDIIRSYNQSYQVDVMSLIKADLA